MEQGKTPSIKSAAILFTRPNGTREVAPGTRHALIRDDYLSECLRTGRKAPVDWEEGFLTDAGDFVDRREAMAIAREAGQLKRRTDRLELNSEDLW